MKKVFLVSSLIIWMCFLQVSGVFASVNMRMRFVSNTPDKPVVGRQMLIFYIQAKSVNTDTPHEIGSFQYVMQFGAELWQQLPGTTDEEKAGNVTFINGYLKPDAFYTRTITSLPGRRFQIQYSLEPGQAPFVIPTDRWIRISRMVIVFDILADASSQILWAEAPPFQVMDTAVPTNNITGSTVGELDDISLPVELTALSAIYVEQENGQPAAHIQWETMSEINCAGFYIERADDGEFGTFQKISPLFPGHGTTTEKNSYEFRDDRNVSITTEPDTTSGIWYQIVEVDYDGAEEVYGPVPLSKETPLPTLFVLDQNYPNPFNPNTYIQYSLPEKAQVEVTVFNLLGVHLKTLINTEQQKGTYLLLWDSTDSSGRPVGSGVYFYKLKAGNQILVRKMTLVR